MGSVVALSLHPEIEHLQNELNAIQKELKNSPFALKGLNLLSDRLTEQIQILAEIGTDPFINDMLDRSFALAEKIETVRLQMRQKDCLVLEQIEELDRNVFSLERSAFFLSSQTIVDELDQCRQSWKQLQGSTLFHEQINAKMRLAMIEEKLKTIEFRLHYPICEELNELSYYGNFMTRMQQLAEGIEMAHNEQVLLEYRKLSAGQRDLIEKLGGTLSRQVKKGLSKENILGYLYLLQDLCSYGKKIHFEERIHAKFPKRIQSMLGKSPSAKEVMDLVEQLILE